MHYLSAILTNNGKNNAENALLLIDYEYKYLYFIFLSHRNHVSRTFAKAIPEADSHISV